MVLKAIRKWYTEKVSVFVYLRFNISQPKIKESENALQPSNSLFIHQENMSVQ